MQRKIICQKPEQINTFVVDFVINKEEPKRNALSFLVASSIDYSVSTVKSRTFQFTQFGISTKSGISTKHNLYNLQTKHSAT